MPNTFELIASSTVGSGGASTIDFTSIPSTYTDLVLKVSARTTTAAVTDDMVIRFNADSGNNYNVRALQGNGSAASSFTSGTQSFIANVIVDGNTATSSTFANTEIYIPNYAGSNQKSISIDTVQETNASGATMRLMAGIWTGTAAITSITLYQNFVQYSTAYLYGVKNA